MEFSLIPYVATAADNDEINGIFKPGDIVFLKLNLLSTIIKREIWVYISL